MIVRFSTRLRGPTRLRGREFLPDAERVLDLVGSSPCSAYDCEYVAVAESRGAPLITSDLLVVESFPDRAVPPERFAGRTG